MSRMSRALIAHYKMNENTASDNAELVVNGDFSNWTDDDPDGWDVQEETGAGDPGTRDPEVSQVGTGEDHTDAGGETGGMCNFYMTEGKGLILSQNVTLVVGEKYRLSINFDTITASKVNVHNIGNNQWPAFTSDTPGVHSVDFVCTHANTPLLIEDKFGADTDVTFDDVSIRLCPVEDSSGNDHDGVVRVSDAETIDNGDFSEDPGGWTLDGTWAIAGGVCSADGDFSYQYFGQNLSPRAVFGRKYVISYEVTANTLVGSTDLEIGAGSCWGYFGISGVVGKHTYTKEVTKASPSYDFIIYLHENSTGGSISIDNVSVKLSHLNEIDTEDIHVAGKVNGAFDFDYDGSQNFVDIGNHGGTVKSIAMWVKPDAVDVTDYPIDLNGTDYITIVNGTVTVNGFGGSAEIIYVDGIAASTVTANWHFVVITATAGFIADDLDIGRLEGSGYFDGLIDNVMLFSETLTPAEQRRLFNNGHGTEIPADLDEPRLLRRNNSPIGLRARYER